MEWDFETFTSRERRVDHTGVDKDPLPGRAGDGGGYIAHSSLSARTLASTSSLVCPQDLARDAGRQRDLAFGAHPDFGHWVDYWVLGWISYSGSSSISL